MDERKDFLGASDVPVVMGLSPFMTQYELALEKQGKLKPKGSTDATRVGQALEPMLVSEAEKKLGKMVRNLRTWHMTQDGTPLSAQLDAQLVADPNHVVEAKTSGVVGPLQGEWGEPNTDVIPGHYIVQVHVQMVCSHTDLAHVVALLGGRGIVHYQVHRDDELVRYILEKCDEFWRKYVAEGGLPDDNTQVPLDVYRRIVRDSDKRVELMDVAQADLTEWTVAKGMASHHQRAAKEYERYLLRQLGDAEIGVLPDGREITYFETYRRGYTVEPTTYRQLRVRRRDEQIEGQGAGDQAAPRLGGPAGSDQAGDPETCEPRQAGESGNHCDPEVTQAS